MSRFCHSSPIAASVVSLLSLLAMLLLPFAGSTKGLRRRTEAKLRVRAAHSGRSMEAEAREILRRALEPEPAAATDLATAIRELFRPLGGVELERPERDPIREPQTSNR